MYSQLQHIPPAVTFSKTTLFASLEAKARRSLFTKKIGTRDIRALASRIGSSIALSFGKSQCHWTRRWNRLYMKPEAALVQLIHCWHHKFCQHSAPTPSYMMSNRHECQGRKNNIWSNPSWALHRRACPFGFAKHMPQTRVFGLSCHHTAPLVLQLHQECFVTSFFFVCLLQPRHH